MPARLMYKLPKLLLYFFIFVSIHGYGQSLAVRSALINFGSNTCGNTSNISLSSIGNPNSNPYIINSCSLSSIFSDINNKFSAYNPRDNKIYINDISHGDSRVYVFDMGLPNNYVCPPTPTTPTYQYSYVPNNWEFDINGNVWCIKGLSGTTASIERIDITTGTVLSTKNLDFPANNIPNTLSSGDIAIMPNGRLFIAVGDSPTKFFEVNNYVSGSGNATATFIQNMPKACYGILYTNGFMELTGTDFGSNCYKYVYDISAGVMSAEQQFQLNMSPIDNASISPAIGISKELKGSTFLDATTAIITYQVNAKNMGNVKLNNFNVSDDLGVAFGAANVSEVHVSWDAGNNPVNLQFNPNYDGINDTKIFTDNQVFSNFTDGYVSFTLSLKASNLVANKTYLNSAKSMGEIGEGGIKVSVVDSSNNGTAMAIDPNSDGDAGEYSENVPTPFFFGSVLPVHFVAINAENVRNNLNTVKWIIGESATPVTKFEVEYNVDDTKWQLAGTVSCQKNKTSYFLDHTVFSGNYFYYRIKAYDNKGQSYTSKEVLVRIQDDKKITILPNPADDAISVNTNGTDFNPNRKIYIINALGKEVYQNTFSTKNIYIHTSSLPDGYYVVKIQDDGCVSSYKILIRRS